MKALYLLNPQIDFCEGGALGIPGASALLNKVHQLLESFDKVYCIKEIHSAEHLSFAANHPWRRPGQVITIADNSVRLMISHCVEGQFGSFLAPPFQTSDFDNIIELGNLVVSETDRELIEKFEHQINSQIEKHSIQEVLILGLEHNDLSKRLGELLGPRVKKLEIGEILKFKEL